MHKKKLAIGIDLGGTYVRAAIADQEGNFLARMEEKIDIKNERALSDQIVSLAQSLCVKSSAEIDIIEKIGISSTGPLDLRKGALVKPTNLPFRYVPLTKPVSKKSGIPAILINDCTAGVLGEKEFGAGRNLDNLVYIALGTGIGGGAIVDDHVLSGKDGNAVEIGHLTIDYEGRLICGCGKKGHWEAYCSGKNIPNFVKMKFEEVNEKISMKSLLFRNTSGDFSKLKSEDVYNAAKLGDSFSLNIVEEIGRLNAIGFADVVNSYDPSLITVGGSVALNNKRAVLQPIKRYLKDYARNRVPKVLATPLGKDAGIYGAIAAVLKS